MTLGVGYDVKQDSGGSITNDGTYAKETGGNLADILSKLNTFIITSPKIPILAQGSISTLGENVTIDTTTLSTITVELFNDFPADTGIVAFQASWDNGVAWSAVYGRNDKNGDFSTSASVISFGGYARFVFPVASSTNFQVVVDSNITSGGPPATARFVNVTVSGSSTATTLPIINPITNTVPISGSVAVSNSAGASAVNIQDGGNTITVDGTVAVSSIPSVVVSSLPAISVASVPVVADTGNTTSTPLGIGGIFTGTAFDLNNYSTWSISIFSNVASAVNGISIQWSEDGTNWDFSDTQSFIASAGNMITFGRKTRYVRLVYTNGAVGQGTFRVKAWAQPAVVRQTRKFIGNPLLDQDTGQVVIAALQGHTTAGGGAWVDVKVNPSGALTADVTGSIISTKTDLTPSAPAVAAVGIASASAVASSATRKGLILRNVSTLGQRISLGFGSAAVLDSGIVLYPQDCFHMNEYDFDLGQVNAIASAAAASLAIQEYTT